MQPICVACKKEMLWESTGTFLSWLGSMDGNNHAGHFVHQGACHAGLDSYMSKNYRNYAHLSLPWYEVPMKIRKEILGEDFQWPQQPKGRWNGLFYQNLKFAPKKKLNEKKKREKIIKKTLSLRFDIMKRDGYRCRLCGIAARDGDHVRLEVDHITPRSKGGNNHPSNLWVLCFDCNRGKGRKLL